MENSSSAPRADSASQPTGHEATRIAATWVSELGDESYAAVERFLRKPSGRRIATARDHMDRVVAVNDFLNSYGLPPSGAAPPTVVPETVFRCALPAVRPLPRVTVQDALEARRSSYRFSTAGVSLEELGDLLCHATHIYFRDRAGAAEKLALSPAPSAGGLNPVRIYVVASNVTGLPVGIYEYDRARHQLELVRAPEDVTRALGTVYGQPGFAESSAATLAMTADLDTSISKYGSRHYRTSHLDTGIVIQNLYMVSTALGLGGCAVSGYQDEEAASLLGLRSREIVMALFPVGRDA